MARRKTSSPGIPQGLGPQEIHDGLLALIDGAQTRKQWLEGELADVRGQLDVLCQSAAQIRGRPVAASSTDGTRRDRQPTRHHKRPLPTGRDGALLLADELGRARFRPIHEAALAEGVVKDESVSARESLRTALSRLVGEGRLTYEDKLYGMTEDGRAEVARILERTSRNGGGPNE